MIRWAGLLLAAAGFAAAQVEPATFTSETREVMLHVSVLDRNDRLIADIPQASFRVTENGKEQRLKLFRREDVPVSMCLLIDSSGSMKDNYQRVVAAALALVRASNPEDEVCFITFNDEAALQQEFTNDLAKLEEAMSQINSQGSTAVRDAVEVGLREVERRGKHDKKVLVVISDGADTASMWSEEAVIHHTQESGVLVYAIGMLEALDRGDSKDARRLLDHLAEESGGLAFYPKTLAEVETITPQIAHEIRNQYTLAYTPLNESLDGSYRKLKVEVKGVGKHTVRHRPGYYAVANQ